jgi:hypothetical protein
MAGDLKAIIEVQAGALPGIPDPDLTRRWHSSAEEWDAVSSVEALLAGRYALAQAYARELLDPVRVRWSRTTWLLP